MSLIARILIIDDEPLLRELMCELVQGEGNTATALEDADAGMLFLEKNAETIDLVITDVTMPGVLDGLELAQLISERWPHLQVMVVSGYYQHQNRCESKDVNFLVKPWAVGHFLSMVNTCLNARRH